MDSFKFCAFLLLSLWLTPGFSQTESISDINWPNLESEGQTVQLRWTPAGKKMKFYFVGKEELSLDLKNMKIEAANRAHPNQRIAVEKEKDHFFIDNGPHLKELRLKISNDKESKDIDLRLD